MPANNTKARGAERIDAWLSLEGTARVVGCSRPTIRKAIAAGKLPATAIANRWCVRRADALEFAKSFHPARSGRIQVGA